LVYEHKVGRTKNKDEAKKEANGLESASKIRPLKQKCAYRSRHGVLSCCLRRRRAQQLLLVGRQRRRLRVELPLVVQLSSNQVRGLGGERGGEVGFVAVPRALQLGGLRGELTLATTPPTHM
jgi:hypothetical protein